MSMQEKRPIVLSVAKDGDILIIIEGCDLDPKKIVFVHLNNEELEIKQEKEIKYTAEIDKNIIEKMKLAGSIFIKEIYEKDDIDEDVHVEHDDVILEL